MELAKSEILRGVHEFQKNGAPGTIVVFGDKSIVLVTGENEEDIVVAAGVYGAGRVVAFSHDSYGNEIYNGKASLKNSKIYDNIRKWLSSKDEDIKMCLLDTAPAYKSIEELKAFDILINTKKEKVPEALVDQYVKEGGAFVQAFTPWGWLQLNPKKSLLELPYAKLLSNVGIAFWDGVVHSDTLKVVKPCTDLVVSGEKKAEDEKKKQLMYNASFIKMVCKLPLEQCIPFKPAVGKIWNEICSMVAPLCTSDKVTCKTRTEKIVLDTWCSLAFMHEDKHLKAQGIRVFPGDYQQPPPRKCTSMQFKSSLQDTHFTACHIPAGAVANLKVTAIQGTWTAVVGAHSDCLTDSICRRWPNICHKVQLKECTSYELRTPFGGSIYLVSPQQPDAHISVDIDDVVMCPRYDIADLSIWNKSKDEPGLWADLSGKYITFTMPSKSVRKIKDPRPALVLYDQLLQAYHDLKGTRIEGHRRMWVVCDEQPVAGYMHAGYPIVTHLDVADPNKDLFLLNSQSFLAGKFWGIFHEIGHNMQEEVWTFEGTSEVTVNIFTLYGMHSICRQPVLNHPWLREHLSRAKKYLEGEAKFSEWQANPGLALFVYAQLVHHFGWDAYKAVFRTYNSLQTPPISLQPCIDLWYVTFSKQVRKNLSPWADLWGISLSETARKELSGLPAHLPEDPVSLLCPSRLQTLKQKYSL